MERSSENQKVQNEGEVIFTSEIEIQEEMKGIEKNPSLQIESCKIPKLNEGIYKLNKFWNNYIFTNLCFLLLHFLPIEFLSLWDPK
jgi:hypothetical protein